MRSAGHLLVRIPERENLLLALWKALRGQRHKREARAFIASLHENLNALAQQISDSALEVGHATEFIIHDPKQRLITAPCFAERVLHHAMMNVCEPEFERHLIHHSYACRKGRGQFAALHAAQHFAAGHGWFMQMDVRKYFDSIPKALLLARLGRMFREGGLVGLFTQVIHAYRLGEPTGLPIGSLISQHCANLYLDAIDRHITERCGQGAYVRYMDDFVVWAPDCAVLQQVAESTGEQLTALGLEFKREPVINRTAHGMDFLGHRIFPHHTQPSRRSRARYVRKLRGLHAALHEGEIPELEAQQRLTSVSAFVQHFTRADWRNRAMAAAGCEP